MFDDNVYLSIGLEAKCNIYNSFDTNKPYNINCLLILWSDPKAQIITVPTLIRQKQQTPHSLQVRLHSWMLYTPQAPMLDLTGEHIKTKEDIEAAFHSLNLCTHDEQKSDGAKGHKAKQSK